MEKERGAGVRTPRRAYYYGLALFCFHDIMTLQFSNMSKKAVREMDTVLPITVNIAEIIIMHRDASLLKEIVTSLDPDLIHQSIPFLALFCNEVGNYIKVTHDVDVIQAQTSLILIKDIRDANKLVCSSFAKTMDWIGVIQYYYDQEFSLGLMGQPNLKKPFFYNLGITYNGENQILANTFYTLFSMQKVEKSKRQTFLGYNQQQFSEQIMHLGYDMGSTIAAIDMCFQDFGDFVHGAYQSIPDDRHFRDYNTHHFGGEGYAKIANVHVFLLQIISNIGFVIYHLRVGFIRDTGLLLRIEYVVLHNTYRALICLDRYLKESSAFNTERTLLDCVSNINKLACSFNFKTEFRNCMMHYRLTNKNGELLIKSEFADLCKPLCGLVESIFDGESYNEYKNKVEGLLEQIYTGINLYLNL